MNIMFPNVVPCSSTWISIFLDHWYVYKTVYIYVCALFCALYMIYIVIVYVFFLTCIYKYIYIRKYVCTIPPTDGVRNKKRPCWWNSPLLCWSSGSPKLNSKYERPSFLIYHQNHHVLLMYPQLNTHYYHWYLQHENPNLPKLYDNFALKNHHLQHIFPWKSSISHHWT